jgi:hypothetical protein
MNGNEKARLELEAHDRAESAEQGGRRQLWERQVGESPKAFHAFRLYRDAMEKRTLAKVAETLGCSSTNVERWARRWAWTQRTYEYDLMMEEEWQRQASRDRIQMRRRQIQLGQVLQSVAAYAIREWQQKIEQSLPLHMDPVEVAGLLKLGNELEAKGHGEERDGGRYTKINVVIGTLSDEVFEEQCRAGGGRPAKRPGDGGATMTFGDFEARQYENLSDEEKAAEATWKDPPKKLTN